MLLGSSLTRKVRQDTTAALPLAQRQRRFLRLVAGLSIRLPMLAPTIVPEPNDVLLVIDMQVDFMPGGALPVPGGREIIRGINALGRRFAHVLCTQDWHPPRHISFASAHHGKRPFLDTATLPGGHQQHLWPDHCVQGTPGAALDPALDLPHAELILRKGFRRTIDSYSAFTENDGQTPTGLAGYLRERTLDRLFFVGVAFDFCVGFSALAGARLGFQCTVIEDLTRAVDLPETVARTRDAFAAHNVALCRTAGL